MARYTINRITADQLKEDLRILVAIRGMADFVADTPESSVATLNEQHNQILITELELLQAQQVLDMLKNRLAQNKSTFHKNVQRAKQSVVGQYGKESDEIQQIGLKRASEYLRPARRPKEE